MARRRAQSVQGSKRGQYAVGVKRRDEIVRVAIDQIAEFGHHAVTMKSVADDIGVTEPALYYHFPTRDQLLVEVLRYRDQQAVDLADHHIGYDAIIEAMRRSQQTPWFAALYSELASRATDPDHPAHAYFRARYDAFRSLAVEALQAWLGPDEDVDPVDAERLMLDVIAAADGLQARWLVTRDFDIADHTQAIIDRLTRRTMHPTVP